MEAELLVKRFRQLQSQRKNLDNKLQDIDSYCVPNRGEFFNDMLTEHQTDWNRVHLYDSTAVVACKRLASFIHGSMTSPFIKWFTLRYREDSLNTEPEAKEWLEDSEERLWQALGESDFDNNAAELFLDIVSYGTSMMMAEPENDITWKGMNFTTLPVMDSYFEMGPNGLPYMVYRRIRYTRLELEDRFPDMPSDVKVAEPEKASVDAKIEVIFCVYYRDKDYEDDGSLLAPEDRPVGYKYILLNDMTELEEGGYYEFPAMVVRWAKSAGNKWGNSPCLDLLPDIKQLNELVAQTSEARAKAIDPPYMTTERGIVGDLDLAAGGLTVVAEMGELEPLINASRFDQADIERERLQSSIRDGLLLDQITYKDSPAMTATEVLERKQIMLQTTSTTTGRIKTDFLTPLLEIMFTLMLRQGQFKEVPEGLSNTELDIEFTGQMPRAQKLEQAAGIERWLTGLANLAELFPEFMDLPDTDAIGRKLAELNGVPALGIRTQDEVEEIRMQRAQQQQQQQEAEMMRQTGEAAEQMGKGAQEMQMAEGMGTDTQQ